ncbi:MAG TPA: nucleotide exchange factor GrpE [Acidimicrobiales bacterium]
MSFSDEATPEEVPPEPESDTEGTWSEEDSAALAAASSARPSDEATPETDAAEVDPMIALAAERDEYLAALQRNQADFENYRKRIERQQAEQAARASSALVAKLLPVLDTLDLALAHQGEEGGTEDGRALVATRSMLLDLLSKEGLERVDEAEVPFDPSVHDAVAKAESDDESGEMMVDEVLRSGYRWKGQILRPAMVRVRG